MNEPAWFGVLVAAMSLGFTALLVLIRFMVSNARHQTRTEDKLDNAIERLEELVKDKDKVHLAIFEQQKFDRDATDRRLRYLEEKRMQKWF